MAYIACIGSRSLSAEQIETCETLGQFIARCGHVVSSGNAEGADQAFQRGAGKVSGKNVSVHLPWPGFNLNVALTFYQCRIVSELDSDVYREYEEMAAKYHPKWKFLRQGARKLHTRNVGILFPEPHTPVKMVIAWPSQKPGGGGTGQGMRIAEGLGIPLVDISNAGRTELFHLCERIRSL